MVEISYSSHGEPVSDFAVEETFQIIIKSVIGNGQIHRLIFSTENIFLRVRVAICEGEISNEDVRFVWQGAGVPINRDGRINYWPGGFLDTSEKLLLRLI